MRLATLCALFSPLIPIALCQQPPVGEQLTLASAITEALRNNRDLRVAQIDVSKARDRIAVAHTYRLPSVSVDALGLQLLTPLSFFFTPGALGVFPGLGPVPAAETEETTPRRPIAVVTATVAQPISQQFRIGLGIRLSELGQQIAEMRVRSQRQNIVGDLKKVYFGMLQAQASLEAVEEARKALTELDRVVGEYVQEQVALKSDGMEVKSKLLSMDLTSMQLKDGLQAGKEQINRLMGRDIGTPFTIVNEPEPGPEEEDLGAARKAALDNRPDLGEARLKLSQAELDVRSRRSEQIPDVSLVFNYLSPFSVTGLPKNIAGIGASVSWKPFDWGKARHEISEKSLTVEQARTAISQAESGILIEVGANFRKLQESRLKMQIARLNRDTAVEHVRVGTNQYSEKAVLLKEVLQRQAELSESNSHYQEALLAFWTARADFERSIGKDQ